MRTPATEKNDQTPANATPTDEAAQPLRVVRGAPTDEELAAITALVAIGVVQKLAQPSRIPRSRWADPARAKEHPVRAQPGGWVASGRRLT
ncbi:MAG: acyl-CoA carboxylase subunit epsilon [Actinomycetota bacterium]